jgi:hypothetical protein
MLFFALLMGACNRESHEEKAPSAQDGQVERIPPSAPTNKSVLPQWKYEISVSEMSDSVSYDAVLCSLNTVNFGFPYSGEQNGCLILTKQQDGVGSLFLQIKKGQFICKPFSLSGDYCYVSVRFDDNKAQLFKAKNLPNGITTAIIIYDYTVFIYEMKKSKMVRISAEVYQEGSPIFRFNVSEFDYLKYIPDQKNSEPPTAPTQPQY